MLVFSKDIMYFVKHLTVFLLGVLIYIFLISAYTKSRGDIMDKDKQEKLNQKQFNEKLNSITQKIKPENQNQTHNVRSEGVESKIRQV